MPRRILLLNHLVWHTPGHVLRGHNSGKKTHWGTGARVQQSEAGIMQMMKGLPGVGLSRKTGEVVAAGAE